MEVLIFALIFILIFLSKIDLLSQLSSTDEMAEILDGTWQLYAWEAITAIPAFTILVRRVRDAGAKLWVIALAASGPLSVYLRLSILDTHPSVLLVLSLVELVPFAYAFAPSSGIKSGRIAVK